ncbi:MAG: purine nucleoside phosphorylase inosine and guanosine-specific [Bacilli bacterium]|nr:purine nucleoside phosphorylase inosine and guanosine-specific [Bacilli bacterium]
MESSSQENEQNGIHEQMKQTVEYIQAKVRLQPEVGLVLGSGLGTLAEQLTDAMRISYGDIPHFPVSTVEGHASHLVVGKLGNVPVIAMQGRFHYYEGYTLQQVTYPIRVMKELGIVKLVVTNAAGGLRTQWPAGSLMLISDHLNLLGHHPLIGPNEQQWGPRFPDMSEAYSKRMRAIAAEVATELHIPLEQGVYAGLTGPTYETPAEVRMLQRLGADAVGMSTVPEVIVARHMEIEVIGISCITNLAAGLSNQKLSHEEVVETTRRVNADFSRLVQAIVARI